MAVIEKKKFRILLIVGVVSLFWVAAGVAAIEYLAYNSGNLEELSEVIWPMQEKLEELFLRYGHVPESSEEYRQYIEKSYRERGLTVRSYHRSGFRYECTAAKKPFVWKPKGIQTPDGRPVIVMCPLNSHGFLRQFAYGLVQRGKRFCLVKVLENGEVEDYRVGVPCS